MEAFIKFGTGALALAALLVGVVALNSAVPTQVVDNQQVDNEPKAGSITGPDSYLDYYNLNGVVLYPRVAVLTPATTTPCVIKSPSATTTIDRAIFNVVTATSSAATLTFATSTLQNATSSLIATFSLSAGKTGTINWAPGSNNALVAPNTYVAFGAAGVSQGGYTFGGTCSVLFMGVSSGN